VKIAVLRKGRSKCTFNISFFIIVFLLSGLLIYLNRTFDVLTFKEDSGQIVYEILLILIVSSALAAGKIRQNLKYLAIWAGIFLVLMAGYSYRSDTKGSVLPRSTPLRTIISCFAVSFFGPTAPTSA
jgi:hypothetical protein